MTSNDLSTHFRVCNICEAMCGLEIKHDRKNVVSIKPDKKDPFSQGHICPKDIALQDVHEDPDRLKMPVKKIAGGWQEISWEEAFGEIGTNLRKIRSKYGADAVALYLGNPTVHNYGSMLFHQHLVKALKTKNLFSATSVDQLPHHFASNFMFGHSLLIPVPDIDRTNHMLIMGANPLASNGSMMSAAGVDKRLRKIQQRRGKVIVIDPRRTETAEMADEHYFIIPGTDVFLLLSMLHVIFDQQLVRPGKNEAHLDGLGELQNLVAPYNPEQVADRVGIPASSIEHLSIEFAKAGKAVCYGRMGLSTQEHGGLCQWLINVLNIVTGHFDTEGGAMFTTPAVDLLMKKSSINDFGRWKSRIRGLPEFKGELPVSVLSEEILHDGKGQIKSLITHAGNPVLSTPNGKKLESALESLEFMVSIDIYINETTKHADIILPPATGLEVDHYDLVFNSLAVRNNAKYSPAMLEPAPNSMYDWQIFKALAREISRKTSFLDRFINPVRLLDIALKIGPYGFLRNFPDWSGSLSVKKLKKNIHGIDLGPLKPQTPKVLKTSNKKINLTPKVFLERLAELSEGFIKTRLKKENGHFLLIGRRHVRSNNSWMHNSDRLMKGKNRCTLLMNVGDAKDSGINENVDVRVISKVGEIVLPVEISNEMMPGVVSMPHGYGHNREGSKISVAQAHAGESINDLMDNQRVDKLTGNAAFSGQSVYVLPVSLKPED
jgi:anaerobic selenocysteine-containing dehydrogenase